VKDKIDDNYIASLINSDPAKGFRLLVEKYSSRLYWHIRRLVVIHEDADDALQNTFIKCWKNIDGFRKESTLFTWLYSIATNEALMVIRKRNQLAETPIEEIATILSNSSEGNTYFDGDEAETLLQNAIQQLPEKQRTVFLLKYYDELTYEEIGEITGTSVGALKASYFHAVKKIEKIVTA
jgi:RNA polymerase sigma-70 factor (ECF subfamily)